MRLVHTALSVIIKVGNMCIIISLYSINDGSSANR